MIYTCLPSGNMHGWGVAGTHIRKELSAICEHVDVSGTKVATIFPGPVLMAIGGSDGAPMNPNVQSSSRYVGYGFCEDPDTAANFLDAWNAYDVAVCGSSWMQRELSRIGVRNTAVALQGVDYEIFKPSDVKPNKSPFVVLSAGKFEYRKGQDIVIAAMSKWIKEDPDVRLIAAWAQFWPSLMRTMEKSGYIRYEHVSDRWDEQVCATLIANEIPLDRVLVPEIMDNSLMVELYHSAHLGLFPSRVEAGNNLIMCEAVASGLPVMADRGTGQGDIAEPCGQMWFDFETLGLDRLVRDLKLAKKNYSSVSKFCARGSDCIRDLISWPKCARQLLDILEGDLRT